MAMRRAHARPCDTSCTRLRRGALERHPISITPFALGAVINGGCAVSLIIMLRLTGLEWNDPNRLEAL